MTEDVLFFYAQKQLLLSARLSHRNSVCPSVIRVIGQKWCKLESPNLLRRCLEDSSFRNRKASPQIRRGSPR